MIKPKPTPPQADLQQALDYDPETGKLRWKWRADMSLARNMRWVGTPAFDTLDALGYYRGRIFQTHYLTHRIVWKLVTGTEPEEIDHINGNPGDNRIENLRSVPHSQNMQNLSRRPNSSGVLGVRRSRSGNKWIANITINGRTVRIGRFDTLEEAAERRRAAEKDAGYHENHGRAAA